MWALVLGLSVWVAAVTAADPDEARPLPDPVSLDVVGQDPGLVVTGEVPEAVRLTLRAPQSVWNQIMTNPDSVRAVLDLSGVKAGEHRLALQIQIDARPVRIESINPASVQLQLEPLVSRRLELQTSVSGQPAVGYQA